MGHERSPAIVIKATDFGESDRIVHFFTREFGRVRGVAKGAKRSLRRFIGSLEFPAHVDLLFFEKKTADLVRVETATLLGQFAGIRSDLGKLSEASLLVEIIAFATGEHEPHRPLFDALIRGLSLIDRLEAWEKAGPGVSRLLEIRLLSLLGFEPELAACVGCRGSTAAIARPAFSIARGGVLCTGCSGGERDLLPIGRDTLQLLGRGLRSDIDLLPRFAWTPRTAREAARLLHPFAQAQLGRELRSLRFIEAIARVGSA